MTSTNEILNRLIRKEKKKEVLVWLGLSILMLALIFVYTPPQGKQEIVFGEVLTLTASQSDLGNRLFLIVRIDAGQDVSVFIPNSSFYKKAKRVKLLKIEAKYFGRPTFKYRGYIPDDV